MRFLLASAVVALSATGASASDWHIYSLLDDALYVIDVESIRTGSMTTAWTGRLSRRRDPIGSDYVLIRHEIDCAQATTARTNFTAYLSGGQNIGSDDSRQPHQPARPSSIADDLVKAACQGDYIEQGVADIQKLLTVYRETHP